MSGPVEIKYRAWDGSDGSAADGSAVVNTATPGGSSAFSLGEVTKGIAVTPVNDQPRSNLGSDPAVLEDAGAQSVVGFATNPTPGAVQLEGGQTFTVAITNNNNPLFSVQPAIATDGTGTLTFTPASNQNGTAIVTVVLTDSGGDDDGGIDTLTTTFSIVVNGANDAPVVTVPASVSVLSLIHI